MGSGQTYSPKGTKWTYQFKEKYLVFAANNNIWAFKEKLKFWGPCIHQSELGIAKFSQFKDFSDESGGEIIKIHFLLLCNVIQYVKTWALYLSSKYVPNEPGIILQNYAYIFTQSAREINRYNEREKEKNHWYV